MTLPKTGVKEAILGVIHAQDVAWCKGDAIAFGASALPDIVFTNVVGMFWVGVEPFIAQHAHIFSTIYEGSQLAQALAHLTTVADDIAIVDTVASVAGYRQLPPGVTAIDGVLQTRLEQVLVRRDGIWRVQSFHNVPVNPAAVARRDVAPPG